MDMEYDVATNPENIDNAEDSELLTQLSNMEDREKELKKNMEDMEADFGQKRAKFMELFLQKEDELTKERDLSKCLRHQLEIQEIKAQQLELELNELKSQVTIAEYTKENEIEQEKRKYTEEVASLQQIMKEALEDASHSHYKYEAEMSRLRKKNEKLESETVELKGQISGDTTAATAKESVLSVVTKTLAKRVTSLNAYSQSNENLHENLEDSMKKAQEDAEMLRSLVIPLEEEITVLKDKLRETDRQLQIYESAQNDLIKGCEILVNVLRGKSIEEIIKMMEIAEQVNGEPINVPMASRIQLQLHIATLQTQRTFLQEDMEILKKDFQLEKREHNELKQTWQMANDQFLEAQRLHIRDLQRIEGLLSTSQKKSLAELRKNDEVNNQSESQLHSLPMLLSASAKFSSPALFSPLPRKSPSPKRAMLGSRSENDVALSESSIVERVHSVPADLSLEDSLGISYRLEESLHNSLINCDESAVENADSSLNFSENFSPQHHSLGFDHSKDLNSSEYSGGIITPIKKRLVSEKEWCLIQEELRQSRDRLQRPCDMCTNYEAQLQRMQEQEKELQKKVLSFEKTIEWCKADLKNEQQYRQEVEEKLSQNTSETKTQVNELYVNFDQAQQVLKKAQQEFHICSKDVYAQLRELTSNREQVEEELVRLQRENDRLVGKHSAIASQIQNEAINMPDNLEEMHLLFLQQREDLITAKLSKEHTEETLRSEIQFLKDQILAEQHNKDSMEDNLTQEIDTLREKNGILESIQLQLELEQKQHNESKTQLQEITDNYNKDQEQFNNTIKGLKKDSDDIRRIKEKLETEVAQFRSKVQTLQHDLENSEVVQKAFVKLSQSLQVQLEKIRGSEKEVRWQHEEDVEECNNCKQPFTVTRRRHHCRHCGKIFCAECSSRVVNSGPNFRPSKVCDVCHTLLIPDTAPYFSNEPPHTPD